jgi:hypothetical protein
MAIYSLAAQIYSPVATVPSGDNPIFCLFSGKNSECALMELHIQVFGGGTGPVLFGRGTTVPVVKHKFPLLAEDYRRPPSLCNLGWYFIGDPAVPATYLRATSHASNGFMSYTFPKGLVLAENSVLLGTIKTSPAVGTNYLVTVVVSE